MFEWEREALGVQTMGGLKGVVRAAAEIDLNERSESAWWIATLFGPDMWANWRVGLRRGSISATTKEPMVLPEPLVLKLPGYLTSRTAGVGKRWDQLAVCPAVIEEKVLGFVAFGARSEDSQIDVETPRTNFEIVAPSDLIQRLGLRESQPIRLWVLSGMKHRPHEPRQR